MSRQLADLRAYSLTFGAFGRTDDLAAARDVARYLLTMLRRDDGVFFASQDADLVPGQHAADYFALPDAARRARGVPRIERAVWSRENGQAIAGLCALQAVDPEAERLDAIVLAAERIVAMRRRVDGTFAHDHADADVGGPFLADSLEMANALLGVAEVTADPRWQTSAIATLHAIDATFARADGGYASAVGDGSLPPVADRTENVQLARVANRAHRASGDVRCRAIAERSFRHVAAPAIARQPGLPADLLLAADELAHEAVHVVVVGARDDAAARQLFATALRAAPPERVVEWIAPGEPTARGQRYPEGDRAAAFVCRDGACSAPLSDEASLGALLGAAQRDESR